MDIKNDMKKQIDKCTQIDRQIDRQMDGQMVGQISVEVVEIGKRFLCIFGQNTEANQINGKRQTGQTDRQTESNRDRNKQSHIWIDRQRDR